MRAIFQYPSQDLNGYLIWAAPYIYPKFELEEGLAALRAKKFNAKLREDGHGIVIGQNEQSELINDSLICSLFPWMEIGFQSVSTELTYDNFIFESQVVLMPIGRIEVYNPIYTDNCSIFPANYMQIDKMNIGHLNRPEITEISNTNLRDEITEVTGITAEKFKELPLAVIRIEYDYQKYISLDQKDDNELIKECVSETDLLIDIIKLIHCNYTVPEFLPDSVGKYFDRYSAMCIYFPGNRMGFIQSRQIDIKTISTGVGIQLHDVEPITYHKFYTLGNGGVRKVLKHALRLHSQVMESDNESLKFVQIVRIWEYLGNPFEYEKISNSKKALFSTISINKSDYNKYMSRVEELTAGLKDENGKRIPVGIRTAIVHNGESINKLISNPIERIKLFKECFKINFDLLNFMLNYLDMEWDDFHELRLDKLNKLK